MKGDTIFAYFDTSNVRPKTADAPPPRRRPKRGHRARGQPRLASQGRADPRHGASSPAADSQPELRTLVSDGDAHAFYQLPPKDKKLKRPAIDYTRGRTITIQFEHDRCRRSRSSTARLASTSSRRPTRSARTPPDAPGPSPTRWPSRRRVASAGKGRLDRAQMPRLPTIRQRLTAYPRQKLTAHPQRHRRRRHRPRLPSPGPIAGPRRPVGLRRHPRRPSRPLPGRWTARACARPRRSASPRVPRRTPQWSVGGRGGSRDVG